MRDTISQAEASPAQIAIHVGLLVAENSVGRLPMPMHKQVQSLDKRISHFLQLL
jgi:hypothetical protein